MNQAPTFCLPDQNGKEHCLEDYKGQWVLVYFYPKDDTPGCTIEACQMRDNWPHFEELGIQVFGISADDAKSHKKFEEKFQLPFTLLSDTDKKVVEAYGVLKEKKMFGKSYMGISRESFLVDPEGNIAKHYPQVKPDGHAEEVLADIKALS